MGSVANNFKRSRWPMACLAFTFGWICTVLSAHAQYLRIVNYNIEADVNGNTTPNSGLYTVLEAIGEQNLNGVLQPIDILALEETTSNAVTVAPIVTALNSYYGTGTYLASPYQGTQNGSASTGNGPNALIYNTKTVQLVSQGGVAGTPNAAGVNRQVVRYQFQAVGAATATYFYVYVSHMKSSSSGSSSTDQSDRNAEAKLIRADSATLPAGTSTFYVGDLNMDGSSEAAYQTLTATGTGQGVDALNIPQNNSETWDSATYQGILTETAIALKYRDDIQFMTADVYGGTASAALRYVPGSMRAFGNNGTTTFDKSVNQTSNTALNNLVGSITASSALSALTTGSDHLPEVADYVVSTPYNTWQLQHFTTADLANPAISGDLADPRRRRNPQPSGIRAQLGPQGGELDGLTHGGANGGRRQSISDAHLYARDRGDGNYLSAAGFRGPEHLEWRNRLHRGRQQHEQSGWHDANGLGPGCRGDDRGRQALHALVRE